jgi:hypothetical protein
MNIMVKKIGSKKKSIASKKIIPTKTYTRKRISKAVCRKQTRKKYITRPSPPYRAAMCIGLKKPGNDGSMYISKPGPNYGPAKWIKVV